MNGFSILFLIFAICVLLTGFCMHRGHKLELLAWKAAFKNLTIDEWKNVGKWTMISSIILFLIAIIGLLFDLN